MSIFNDMFYDFITHPIPDGSDSITRLAYEAKKYGYCGIGIINSESKLIHKPENFSVYKGIEISCSHSKIKNEVKNNREKTDIIIIKGGNEDTNRCAVETSDVDILLQPIQVNNVIAKIASDNYVAFGFDLGSIIYKRGGERIKELNVMKNNLKHARKYDVPILLTSNSYSHYDLRPPRDMVALASIFGMTKEEAVKGMTTTPLEILRRRSPNYIQEGVEILYE